MKIILLLNHNLIVIKIIEQNIYIVIMEYLMKFNNNKIKLQYGHVVWIKIKILKYI